MKPDDRFEHRMVRLFEPKATASVTIRRSSQSPHPILNVTYTNTGKAPLVIRVPRGDEVRDYRGLSLSADGKELPRWEDDPEQHPRRFQERRQLAPNESVSFDVPTQQVWKMPESWQVLEARLTRYHRPAHCLGRVKIQGSEKPFLFRKKDLLKQRLP